MNEEVFKEMIAHSKKGFGMSWSSMYFPIQELIVRAKREGKEPWEYFEGIPPKDIDKLLVAQRCKKDGV